MYPAPRCPWTTSLRQSCSPRFQLLTRRWALPTSRFLHFFFLVGTALCRGERGELGERELCIMAPDKPHDDVWKHLLERKGLAAAASVLEEYGLSCEADVSHLAEEDLGALTSKMKPLQSRLLCQWVEGLAPGGDRGTFVSGSPAATHTASDKVESASGGKEKEKESEGEDSEDEDEGEQEEEEDEESSDEQEDQEDGEEDVIVVGEASAQDAKEDLCVGLPNFSC